MDGNSEIYLVELKTKKNSRLTEKMSIDTEPAWSTEGRKIMFTSERAGSPQIYEIDTRTKKKRRMTTEGNYNARATNLNKNEIVCVHRGAENGNIAKLNLKTRE
jgi:Periplasmic component of the Tol biopolymer transport system